MAWTAPASYSVGQIVNAADLNLVRDNLNYLKGNAGPVAISDVTAFSQTGGFHQIELAKVSETARGYYGHAGAVTYLMANRNPTSGVFLDTAKATAGIQIDGAGTTGFIQFLTAAAANTAAAERMRIDGSGNVGIGTQTPQGKLHVAGVGGGMLFLNANAVTSLQTLAIAGTVTKSVVLWILDVNNTSGIGINVAPFVMQVNTAQNYVNTDTLQVSITAGGAITIARTVGTNGSHQVTILCMYF